MTIQQQVVVITGASSGIGEATAYAFAREGCRLVLAARNYTELHRVAETCRGYGAEVVIQRCDVSVQKDCETLIQTAINTFGTIHILINNAGISMRAVFADTDPEVLHTLMNINFWGTVYCTRYALNELLKNKGSVIGVSSVAGIKGLPGRTGYSASKFAMNGFMESLRIENLHKGLHVGVICPGYTASNIRNTALNNQGQAQGDSPLNEGQLMPAATVAEHIVRMVKQRKAEVTLTLQGKLTRWLNKFFPRWVDQLVWKTVAQEKDSPF